MSNRKMDAEWDAYRGGIKRDYLPKLEAEEISQREYDVLLAGDEDAIREFYHNKEQVAKAEAYEAETTWKGL